MPNREVMLAKMTRREFREGIEGEKFSTAIVCVGSHEQHSEHLAMEHDIESVVHIAREAARRLYPQVVVVVPMAVGISEHHMHHKGTISARPGGWLSVLFDVVENMVRHGVKNVLIFNGHGGNTLPVMGTIDQMRYSLKYNAPGVNLQFCSYWDLIPRDFLLKHMETDVIPGHAKEFETAIALALFPENVRKEVMPGMEDQDPLLATAEKGRLYVEEAVEQTVEYLKRMMDGQIRMPELKHFP
ncbi:MAG: creatininase family protein [Syntrophaceae bacterium]|nr:creatininase family protein [Syntrophaceae bacterium]